MSIVIIAFEGAPKVSEEAQKKEALLDARLETKVKGVMSYLVKSKLSCFPGHALPLSCIAVLLECSIG